MIIALPSGRDKLAQVKYWFMRGDEVLSTGEEEISADEGETARRTRRISGMTRRWRRIPLACRCGSKPRLLNVSHLVWARHSINEVSQCLSKSFWSCERFSTLQPSCFSGRGSRFRYGHSTLEFPFTIPAWAFPLGLVLALAGGLVALWCIVAFVARGRGTPAPFDPPREFVAAGPYRYVRNPITSAPLALSSERV